MTKSEFRDALIRQGFDKRTAQTIANGTSLSALAVSPSAARQMVNRAAQVRNVCLLSNAKHMTADFVVAGLSVKQALGRIESEKQRTELGRIAETLKSTPSVTAVTAVTTQHLYELHARAGREGGQA